MVLHKNRWHFVRPFFTHEWCPLSYYFTLRSLFALQSPLFFFRIWLLTMRWHSGFLNEIKKRRKIQTWGLRLLLKKKKCPLTTIWRLGRSSLTRYQYLERRVRQCVFDVKGSVRLLSTDGRWLIKCCLFAFNSIFNFVVFSRTGLKFEINFQLVSFENPTWNSWKLCFAFVRQLIQFDWTFILRGESAWVTECVE